MRRPTERGAPAPAHQLRADVIINGDQMPGGGGGVGDPPNFAREFRRYPFVRVDLEYPLAAASVDPGVAARPLPLPGTLDQAIGKAESDLPRDHPSRCRWCDGRNRDRTWLRAALRSERLPCADPRVHIG